MDWPKARAILLAAFCMVNLVLAYAIWGPSSSFPGMGGSTYAQEVAQVRDTLAELGVHLPQSVIVPKTPPPMRFLRVEYRPFAGDEGAKAPLGIWRDPESGALVYHPGGQGSASREIDLKDRTQVEQAAMSYLREQGWLPTAAIVSAFVDGADEGLSTVAFVPSFEGVPVYSGYAQVDVSARGVEEVRLLRVEPAAYSDASPKAVRPATEALLRLAGRLQDENNQPTTIRSVRLGYYANRTLAGVQPDAAIGWDTVPVWRIELETGEVYYVNGFNGQWES